MNRVIVFARKSGEILHQAWKALALHRLRSLLSVLGIVFAVIAVVIMVAIAEGAKMETMEQIGRLGIDSIIIRNSRVNNEAPGEEVRAIRFGEAPGGLGIRDARAIKQLPGVESTTLARETKVFLAELEESDVTHMLAVQHDFSAARGLMLAKGRFISDIDVQNRHQVCVLGAELARRIGPGAAVGSKIHFDGDPHRVVGILQPRGLIAGEALPLALRDFDNAAFAPLPETDELSFFASENAYLSEIIIRISDSRFIDPVSRAVRHILLRNREGVDNFELIVPRELVAQARQTQRLFNIVLGGIAGISLLVGGIGIMNIMLANVSERTREIGIRRAVGASRQHILAHFLGETILLTLLGGILGIVIGALASLAVNYFIQWRVAISLWPALAALFLSVGVGVMSGIYPAVKAANMDTVDALRHI